MWISKRLNNIYGAGKGEPVSIILLTGFFCKLNPEFLRCISNETDDEPKPALPDGPGSIVLGFRYSLLHAVRYTLEPDRCKWQEAGILAKTVPGGRIDL